MYNNAAMANRVREAILLNPRVSAQDILIRVTEGIVTLEGDVDTPQQRTEAAASAAQVDGVRHVENVLVVRPGRWPPLESETLPKRGGR
jgi:osmotically-inducible protein OsmY